MQIVHYPHPALRFPSADVTRIDARLRETVRDMFDLMYAANGIGLAANQVDLPLRLFIVNLSADPNEPDDEQVFINPVITNRGGQGLDEEGCLSLPNLYADVRRPEEVVLEAFDLEGQGFRMKLKELPARVVQHELDHLDGVLFIDKIDESERTPSLLDKLADFEADYLARRQAGKIPSDEEIQRRLEAIARAGHLGDG